MERRQDLLPHGDPPKASSKRRKRGGKKRQRTKERSRSASPRPTSRTTRIRDYAPRSPSPDYSSRERSHRHSRRSPSPARYRRSSRSPPRHYERSRSPLSGHYRDRSRSPGRHGRRSPESSLPHVKYRPESPAAVIPKAEIGLGPLQPHQPHPAHSSDPMELSNRGREARLRLLETQGAVSSPPPSNLTQQQSPSSVTGTNDVPVGVRGAKSSAPQKRPRKKKGKKAANTANPANAASCGYITGTNDEPLRPRNPQLSASAVASSSGAASAAASSSGAPPPFSFPVAEAIHRPPPAAYPSSVAHLPNPDPNIPAPRDTLFPNLQMIIGPGELHEDMIVYVGAREVQASIFVFAAFFVDTSPLGYRILGATVQGKQKSIQSAEIMACRIAAELLPPNKTLLVRPLSGGLPANGNMIKRRSFIKELNDLRQSIARRSCPVLLQTAHPGSLGLDDEHQDTLAQALDQVVWAKVQRGIVLDNGQSLITVDMPGTLEVKSHFEEIVLKRSQYRANLARTVADIARRLPPNPSQHYDFKPLEESRGGLQEARPESFTRHPDTRDMKLDQPWASHGQPSSVAAVAPMQEQQQQQPQQQASSDTPTSHVDRKTQNENARLQRLTALMARLGDDPSQEPLQHPQQSAPAPPQERAREVSHQGPHVSQSSSSTAAYEEGPSYGSFQSGEPSHTTAFPASEQTQPASARAPSPRDYPVKPDLVDLLRTPPREESVEPPHFPGQYARERSLDSQQGMDASDGTDDVNEEGRQDDIDAYPPRRATRNPGGVMDWVKNILPF